MPILCGTDFTQASAAAVTVASQLAVRMQLPLHLVHAVDVAPDELAREPKHELARLAEVNLQHQAERLRAAGVQVEVHIKSGEPDEVLEELARDLAARLVVVGAVGRRAGDDWQLGRHADRTAERSHIPVLVVRKSLPFEAWASGQRPLRILLGVDSSLSSELAGRWISELSQFGPCEVVLTHLYWPPDEFQRLGLGGARSWVDPDTEVTRTLQQEYAERFAALFASGNVTCRLEPHLGRIGDALASLAEEEQADLVVIGCHERGSLARIWEGSVSQRVLSFARTSVACIPAPMHANAQATPAIRNVLAATDFSPIGNCAVPLAYSIVGYGGTVHLVHVLKSAAGSVTSGDIFTPGVGSAQIEAARSELVKFIPKDGAGVAAGTRTHVIEARDPQLAICQAAERLGADVICLGTHGRGGLSRALLGSVAQAVLAGTRRPVLLARAPIE